VAIFISLQTALFVRQIHDEARRYIWKRLFGSRTELPRLISSCLWPQNNPPLVSKSSRCRRWPIGLGGARQPQRTPVYAPCRVSQISVGRRCLPICDRRAVCLVYHCAAITALLVERNSQKSLVTGEEQFDRLLIGRSDRHAGISLFHRQRSSPYLTVSPKS